MFDQSAFDATVFEIRADLERIGHTVGWLAPTAYEQRAGGHSQAPVCGACGGAGRIPANCKTCGATGRYEVERRLIEPHCPPEVKTLPCTNCEPCDECVVAVLGDVGEIVVRRKHVADLLESAAKHIDAVWDIVKGVDGTVAKLANLIDRGASRLPGMEPPTVDPREVAEQVKRRDQRVKRGDELPPIAPIAKDAAATLKQKIRTQDAIDAAIARRAKTGEQVGNRWRR
jgi:hypothetical protein